MNKNITKILVAEDDPDVRRLITRVLCLKGFEVVAVASGDELWKAWTKSHAGIILSDILMPGSMDGIEACLTIRRADPRVRFFLITGNPAAARDAELRGLNVVLRKPFDIYDLEKWAVRIGGMAR